MKISGEGLTFSQFESLVHDEIHKRHLQRISPRLLVATYDTHTVPEFNHIPREISQISVSFWLFCELRKRAGAGAVSCTLIDYVDGKGPRPRWLGILCDIDDSLRGQQARLGPDA